MRKLIVSIHSTANNIVTVNAVWSVSVKRVAA